ncbi:hypothetical protein NA57DRAFT_81474 [Rhizodiscina lignyota]|uniref:Autophagy-related protein 14 n=1 Tax=Rhizodiscina lignyota TaxID=1504668 RepID=A0A9P4I3P7_9PEZI|nr:hypothetical protein NA57DRAFT_81474 [Rhizodiscina lignyota]
MECDICGRHPTPKLGFHCATCARSAIYALRLQEAETLIDRESLGRRVEAVIQGTHGGSQDSITLGGMLVDTSEAAKTKTHEQTLSELDDARTRIDQIVERAASLRQDMEKQKKIIATKKTAMKQRRSDAESAMHGLSRRETKQLEEIQQGTKRQEYKWQHEHRETVRARVYLCKEAANLAGLRVRKVRRDGVTRQFYSVGGIEIFDLRSLNSADPKELSASLTNVAQLLVRTSHYLAVRLPAEITLPHKEYPLPTIFQPQSSYQSREVPFPGSTPSISGHNSPSASRTYDVRPLPRPRTLCIDRRLPQLSREDPSAYLLFIEGVSLLAWNVAWLCRTQGTYHGVETWEDVCALGKNLWQLLVADPRRRNERRESSKDARGPERAPSEASSTAIESPFLLGQFSHGTTHSFLGGADGTQHMREWKSRSHTELIAKVRAHLLHEMQGAEWEVIDQHDELAMEDPEIIGTRIMHASGNGTSASKATTVVERSKEDVSSSPRVKGASGWTKLKSRSGEP